MKRSFGEGGAAAFAITHQLPLLGKVPLDIHIRQASDAGTPIATPIYLEIIAQFKAQLALQKHKFCTYLPKVVVEHGI